MEQISVGEKDYQNSVKKFETRAFQIIRTPRLIMDWLWSNTPMTNHMAETELGIRYIQIGKWAYVRE